MINKTILLWLPVALLVFLTNTSLAQGTLSFSSTGAIPFIPVTQNMHGSITYILPIDSFQVVMTEVSRGDPTASSVPMSVPEPTTSANSLGLNLFSNGIIDELPGVTPHGPGVLAFNSSFPAEISPVPEPSVTTLLVLAAFFLFLCKKITATKVAM